MKAFVILFFGVVLACSNGSDSEQFSEVTYDEPLSLVEAVEVSSISKKTTSTKEQEQKIIQTALLRFETDNLEKTNQKIHRLVTKNNGYVQNDVSGKSYNEYYREMVIRVPTQQFNSVIDSLSKGIAYFDTKDISRKDVTEEYVDIQARLKAKKELEDRYLQLLTQAKNVKEMLEIERELSKIREEIEARQARLNYLQDQVSYSTISLYFYKTTADVGNTSSYGTKMWKALKSGWNGISIFFLGVLHIWPFVLLISAGVYLLKRYLKRKKK